MPMFPAFNSALDDTRLRGAAIAVYLHLSKHLDFVSYRPIKVAAIARGANVKTRTAAWALRHLCDVGYLDRGAKLADVRLFTYRLVWSLAVQTSKPDKEAA